METELTLSRELVELAATVMRIIKQEVRASAGPHAPTLIQFRMLHKIKKGICHVGTLSEAFGISQPATSIMVNTMVKQGFLKRVPSSKDRRQIELQLTAKAKADLETMCERAFAKVDARLSSLSPSKKEAVMKQVREVSRLLSHAEM